MNIAFWMIIRLQWKIITFKRIKALFFEMSTVETKCENYPTFQKFCLRFDQFRCKNITQSMLATLELVLQSVKLDYL